MSEQSKPSVNVYGPPGCGKTTHKESLREKFGLTNIVDAPGMRDSLPLQDALILTQLPLNVRGIRTVSFLEARKHG